MQKVIDLPDWHWKLKYIVEGKKSICHVSVSVLVFFCNKNVYLQKWQEGYISFILFYTVYVCLEEEKIDRFDFCYEISPLKWKQVLFTVICKREKQATIKCKLSNHLKFEYFRYSQPLPYFIITSKYALFLYHLLVILPFILFLFK